MMVFYVHGHPTDIYNIYICTMLYLFEDLWLDKIISKNNDRYRAIYGNLENKINTLYLPVENSIHKNNDADDR
jgi:hypothetical protein